MKTRKKSSAASAAALGVIALSTLCLALAACGRQDGEDQLFLRETEARTQIPPAPEIEDLPPTPAFGADRTALLEACIDGEDAAPEACECLADTAARELSPAGYAYFLAQARGLSGAAARMEVDLSVDDVAEIAAAAAQIALECGVRRAQ